VSQRESEFQIIANNLARESIEVIRSIRDSNSLAGAPWDTQLEPTEAAITILDPSASMNPWQLTTGDPQLYITNGYYTHLAGNGIVSAFRRQVALDSICSGTVGQPNAGEETLVAAPAGCPLGTTRVGLRVRASVTWNERGRDRSINLEDYLYAWR
jgi:hypothetical protein